MISSMKILEALKIDPGLENSAPDAEVHASQTEKSRRRKKTNHQELTKTSRLRRWFRKTSIGMKAIL